MWNEKMSLIWCLKQRKWAVLLVFILLWCFHAKMLIYFFRWKSWISTKTETLILWQSRKEILPWVIQTCHRKKYWSSEKSWNPKCKILCYQDLAYHSFSFKSCYIVLHILALDIIYILPLLNSSMEIIWNRNCEKQKVISLDCKVSCSLRFLDSSEDNMSQQQIREIMHSLGFEEGVNSCDNSS